MITSKSSKLSSSITIIPTIIVTKINLHHHHHHHHQLHHCIKKSTSVPACFSRSLPFSAAPPPPFLRAIWNNHVTIIIITVITVNIIFITITVVIITIILFLILLLLSQIIKNISEDGDGNAIDKWHDDVEGLGECSLTLFNQNKPCPSFRFPEPPFHVDLPFAFVHRVPLSLWQAKISPGISIF